MIQVTEKAVQKIRETLKRQGMPEGGLRLGVQGGGCSGMSYLFRVEGEPRARDHVFEFDGVRVFVDPKSMQYLRGLTLDYQESLMRSGFVFRNPNARKTCGCGSSFTV